MSALRPNPDVVVRRLQDELVLVNMRTNRIYALNRTGARYWELLAEGHDRPVIEARLLQEFDVAPAELSTEIDALTLRLERAGLLGGVDA